MSTEGGGPPGREEEDDEFRIEGWADGLSTVDQYKDFQISELKKQVEILTQQKDQLKQYCDRQETLYKQLLELRSEEGKPQDMRKLDLEFHSRFLECKVNHYEVQGTITELRDEKRKMFEEIRRKKRLYDEQRRNNIVQMEESMKLIKKSSEAHGFNSKFGIDEKEDDDELEDTQRYRKKVPSHILSDGSTPTEFLVRNPDERPRRLIAQPINRNLNKRKKKKKKKKSKDFKSASMKPTSSQVGKKRKRKQMEDQEVEDDDNSVLDFLRTPAVKKRKTDSQSTGSTVAFNSRWVE